MLQTDQRRNQRFELRLPIELVRSGSSRLGKTTETRNVSSGGVLFSSESQLSVGEPIEYFLTLPTGRDPKGTRLHCVGTIIRAESREGRTAQAQDRPFNVAATLERYEFVRDDKTR
ncbi:MAG: PilZ domain-containing protein [Bryobacteraceae bacterium]